MKIHLVPSRELATDARAKLEIILKKSKKELLVAVGLTACLVVITVSPAMAQVSAKQQLAEINGRPVAESVPTPVVTVIPPEASTKVVTLRPAKKAVRTAAKKPVALAPKPNTPTTDVAPTAKTDDAGSAKTSYKMRVSATAYNSLPGQTDSTPFITAAGTHTRDGVIAANFLPFGTKVKIPDLYGDKIFIVEDRMNARYKNRVDLWMENYSDARKFGVREINIEVLGK